MLSGTRDRVQAGRQFYRRCGDQGYAYQFRKRQILADTATAKWMGGGTVIYHGIMHYIPAEQPAERVVCLQTCPRTADVPSYARTE
jgi:hypothetical protein